MSTLAQPISRPTGQGSKPPGLFASEPSPRQVRITLVILALILLIQVSPWWIPMRDGPSYLSIARNLATFRGLLSHGSPHLYYAPGYPMALFPLFLLGPKPFLAISLTHWALLILFTGGVYLWAKRLLPQFALPITLLTAANVGVLYYFRRTGPEAVFMPLLLWTSILMDSLLRPRPARQFAWMLVAAAILAGFLCIVRQAGLTLAVGFCALAIVQAIRGRIGPARSLLAAGIIGITACAATAAVVLHDRATAGPAASTYSEQLTEPGRPAIAQVAEGVRRRIQETGRLMVPGAFKVSAGWTEAGIFLFVPVVIALCLGWWFLMRTSTSTLAWTLPLYLLLYIIWPFEQGSRFMTPMVPLLWLCLLTLLLKTPLRPRLGQILSAMLALGFITSVIYLANDLKAARRANQLWPAARTIAQQLPAGVPVVSLNGCGELPLLLTIERDRDTRELPPGQPIPADINFALAPAKLKILPATFTPILTTDGYTLLQRNLP